MLFSNPRVLPALLLCVGLALVLIRGQELRAMKQSWTEADIDTAVELNYALDLARESSRTRAVANPTEAQKRQRQADIRQELTELYIEAPKRVRREFNQGILMSLIGGMLLVIVLILQRRGILKR